MAKKKAGVNKSKAIKDFKAANKAAKPKAIAEALKTKGINVTPGYVSTILSQSKNAKKAPGRRGRPAGKSVRAVKTSSRKASASAEGVSVDALLRVKKLVGDVGGIEEVRSALQTYEKLMADA